MATQVTAYRDVAGNLHDTEHAADAVNSSFAKSNIMNAFRETIDKIISEMPMRSNPLGSEAAWALYNIAEDPKALGQTIAALHKVKHDLQSIGTTEHAQSE